MDEQPLQVILEVELFDIWGMDFMEPFPSSFNRKYILLAIDYVSKWVEAIPTCTNVDKVVAKFLCSHIFTWFGTPQTLIIDGEPTFYNRFVDNVLGKYDVRHRTSLAYHPQTNRQTKVSNLEIKSILEKTVNNSKKGLSYKDR